MSKRFWLSVLYVLTIGFLSNFAALFVDRKKLSESKFPFRLYGWEKNGRLYDRIAIRRWKNRAPDMSRIFRKLMPKQVRADTTAADIVSLIKETCVSELVHLCLLILSLAVLFICPGWEGLLLYSLCLLGNVPFIIIQRYNRPQYQAAFERLTRREERKRLAYSDSVV